MSMDPISEAARAWGLLDEEWRALPPEPPETQRKLVDRFNSPRMRALSDLLGPVDGALFSIVGELIDLLAAGATKPPLDTLADAAGLIENGTCPFCEYRSNDWGQDATTAVLRHLGDEHGTFTINRTTKNGE